MPYPVTVLSDHTYIPTIHNFQPLHFFYSLKFGPKRNIRLKIMASGYDQCVWAVGVRVSFRGRGDICPLLNPMCPPWNLEFKKTSTKVTLVIDSQLMEFTVYIYIQQFSLIKVKLVKVNTVNIQQFFLVFCSIQ